MAANPITELEFEAYCRRRQIKPTIWEGDLLMRLDDAVLSGAVAKNRPAHTENAGEAPVKDRSAVRRVLSSIGERLRAKGVKTTD